MRKILAYSFIACLLTIIPAKLWAGQKVTVGAKVPAARQVSIDRINHTLWDTLLRKYCNAAGYVNYQAWHASATDLQALDQYLAHLSQASTTQSAAKASQLAFWINAYNAVTVKGILREYPTTSIKNHQSLTFGYKIWDDLLLPVGSKKYSLNQIEHEILRKMGEPRIHFALVCASVGCPPLLNQAYRAQQLDAQLTATGKKFFANPQNFRAQGNSLQMSKLFQWYGGDFGANQAAQLNALAPFMPRQAQALATSGRASVSYLSYSWELNDQATQPAIARQR